MSKGKTEVNFINRNGRTLSQRKLYHENGNLSQEGTFGNGHEWGWNVPVGLIKNYYEDGLLESTVSYDDYGALDGESLYYNRKGELIRKAFYSKDKLVSQTDLEKMTSET